MPPLSVLLTLPTEKESFCKRVASSDYLSRYSLDPELCWSLYEAENAVPLRGMLDEARAGGAQIYEEARYADLMEATTRSEIVVLFSHWKGPRIVEGDIAGSAPAAFLERLADTDTKAGEAVKAYIASSPPDDLFALRGDLNDFIDNHRAKQSDTDGFGLAALPFTHQSLNREVLDDLFDGLLRPGNVVEFTDGLYSREMIARAVAQSFTGILDLTTCTSTFLSDYLSRPARGRYFSVQFDEKQNPAVASLVLTQVFELHRAGMKYSEARRQAIDDFISVLQDLGRQKKPCKFFEIVRSLFK